VATAPPADPRSHPQPSDQIAHRLRRGRQGGRPSGFDADSYKQRITVERCINDLKQ
jgi:hypothetical protein